MAISAEIREQVRQRFAYRCGYCGVHEHEVGSELELDHFHPRSKGGSDELNNLIYCCPACNRFKRDYWPTDATATQTRRLLHPLRDRWDEHLIEEENGRIRALTESGAFHLASLHLNRPQLLAVRTRRRLQNEIYLRMDAAIEKSQQMDQDDDDLTNQLREVWRQFGRLRNL
jgi:HNH endonuclease